MAITFKKRYKDEMTGEWSCPNCDLKLESQHAFTVHIRNHNPTDHSHICSICNKQLSSASSLDRHMLIHSGERPFGCSICHMKFTTNGNMHRHMRTHGQEQQEACGYLTSYRIDDNGLRIRTKKKRKTKSLPDSNSPINTNAQSQNNSFGFDDLSIKDSFLALLQLQNRGFDFNFDQNSDDPAIAANFCSQFPKSLNQLDQLNLSDATKQLLQQQLNNTKNLNNKLMTNDDLDDSEQSEHRSTASSEEQQENLLNKNGLYGHDDEINKLAFKRSLAQNSTLYNTLLNNSLTAAASAINGNTNGTTTTTNNKSDLADISSILSVISSVPMLANVTSDLQQHLPSLNDEQLAKFNQTLHQQTLQDQVSQLKNNNLSNGTTKQNGKRSKNNNSQHNSSARSLTNGTTNGKRLKKESKTTTTNNTDFTNDLSSLANLSNLNNLTNLNNSNNLTNSLNNLKNSTINNSLNSINNLMNEQLVDDQGSDKSIKNGSDIENEMINSKLFDKIKQSFDKRSSSKSIINTINSSTTTSQSLLTNLNSQPTMEHDDTMEDEEDEVNLSEEEEANKLEQELCEQIKKEKKKTDIDDECKSDQALEIDEDKKDELSQKDLSTDDLNDNDNDNDLASIISKKPNGQISENLADLLIKSDKNNNKNMLNNNGGLSESLSQRLFIDPMVEDDVRLLERQLQDQHYLCKICHLEVRSVNTLRRHQRLHDAGGQLYACHYCQYTSLDKSSLIRHLRTHNGERPYQCTICKYAFTTKANCERHVRKRHKKQNKNEIRVSMQYKMGGNNTNNNSTDGLISSLNGSIQSTNNQSDQFESTTTIDNIPPSSLVETNKSLLASSNMHLIPHIFYEPNSFETECRFCNVDFRFNRLLRQHLRTMANNNFTKKPFNCILCNQGFTTKNVCVRHFEKNHKDVSHDQIQNMILEIPIENIESSSRFGNGLNASTLAALSSTTGSGSSELMSNGDSSEFDQPLNLVNGLYSNNKLNSKLNHLNNDQNDKFMDEDDEFDDDNQNALDLSVKSNERQSIDQLSSMSKSLDLGGCSNVLNNQLNEPSADMIRNAITTLLALQSVMPNNKTMENQQLVAQANNLLNGGQLNANLNNMTNLLAAQQMQNNSSNSLLNLFNPFM